MSKIKIDNFYKTLETIEEKIKNVHGDNVKIDMSTYINTSTKCKFIDSKFGEFWMLPSHVFNGSGHIERGKIKQTQLNVLNYRNMIQSYVVTLCTKKKNKSNFIDHFVRNGKFS
jgi:hypothetical protein